MSFEINIRVYYYYERDGLIFQRAASCSGVLQEKINIHNIKINGHNMQS